MFTGFFSAKAQSGTWICGNFSVICLDTIVDDCSLNIICGGSVNVTNLDSVNSITIHQTLNTITNSPSGWLYSMCTPNGCLPTGIYSTTFVVPPLSTRGAAFHAHINGNPGNSIINVSFTDNNNSSIGTTFNIQLGLGTSAVNEQIASENSLSQNFPNPFTGTSVMNYNLPSGKGALVISDVLGRTISNTALNAISGNITIGEGLSEGIFFCTLVDENGKTLVTRKIIVQ